MLHVHVHVHVCMHARMHACMYTHVVLHTRWPRVFDTHCTALRSKDPWFEARTVAHLVREDWRGGGVVHFVRRAVRERHPDQAGGGGVAVPKEALQILLVLQAPLARVAASAS